MNRWLLLGCLLTALAFGASFYVFAHRAELLPEKVPTHWGITGEPDAWTKRDDMFWLLLLPPFLMVAGGLMALALPWLSPQSYRIALSNPTYQYCMFLMIALFGALHAVILMGYCDPSFSVARWLVVGISVFFMLIGNVLGQIPRNFWIGVRTPWTLASNLVWVKTHRLSAWLFVADGFVCALLALLGAPLWLVFPVFVGTALVPVGYSLWLYKRLEREGKLEPA